MILRLNVEIRQITHYKIFLQPHTYIEIMGGGGLLVQFIIKIEEKFQKINNLAMINIYLYINVSERVQMPP